MSRHRVAGYVVTAAAAAALTAAILLPTLTQSSDETGETAETTTTSVTMSAEPTPEPKPTMSETSTTTTMDNRPTWRRPPDDPAELLDWINTANCQELGLRAQVFPVGLADDPAAYNVLVEAHNDRNFELGCDIQPLGRLIEL